MNLVTGVPVRTRYREQVHRIAPRRLVGRERELAGLAEFCADDSMAGRYVWLQAPAWAGKSALLSWFVLHPPEGVRIVSFFVTARFASQNDRVAFCDNVLEQLAALLGEPVPALLGESTREAHLLGLLRAAAQACRERGERFVLLVDGLDEDRDADTHSIAALLPAEPPAGMRVIVAGRPNPPLPADVRDYGDHPLCDPAVVRRIEPAEAAKAVRLEMERSLDLLLDGPDRDLLGLVTAAGGGLSVEDLAELTGRAEHDVRRVLDSVPGRSFTVRASLWQPASRPGRYVLGHEELHATAVVRLGPRRLAGDRERIHTWADGYRDRGWPAETPEYLLHGYVRMLAEQGEFARSVTCATDPARHTRLLDLSGGDAAAVDDIRTAGELVLARPEPDVAAMARLALHRDHLGERNSTIPADLPALWARLGHPDRGEALLRSLAERQDKTHAFAALIEAMVETGHHERAHTLAEQRASSTGDEDDGLFPMVRAFARTGALDRAESLVRRMSESMTRGFAAAAYVAASTDMRRSVMFVREVCHTEHGDHPWHALVRVLARTEGLDQATALANSAPAACRSAAMSALAEMIGEAGDLPRAQQMIRADIDSHWRHGTVLALARIAAVAGDLGPVERALASTGVPSTFNRILSTVVIALAKSGNLDGGLGLLRRRRFVGREGALWLGRSIAGVVSAIAATGDLARAEALIGEQKRAYVHGQGVAALVPALVSAGDPGRAEQLIPTIRNPLSRYQAMMNLAGALLSAGATDRAREVATALESAARSDVVPRWLGRAWLDVVDAVDRHGEQTQAERLVADTVPQEYCANAWALLARTAAKDGDLARADRLADHVTDLELARGVHDARARSHAESGDLDRAEELLGRGSGDTDVRTAVVTAAVKADDLDRAVRLAEGSGLALAAAVEALAELGRLDQAQGIAHSLTGYHRDVAAKALNAAHLRDLVANQRFDDAVAHVRDLADDMRGDAWRTLATSIAALDPDRALVMTLAIDDVSDRDRVLWDLVRTVDSDHAERFAREFNGTLPENWVWTPLVTTVANSGDLDRAEALAAERPAVQAQSFHALTGVAVRLGELARAEGYAQRITDTSFHDQSCQTVVEAAVAAGELKRAERLVAAIVTPRYQGKAWRAIAATGHGRALAQALRVDDWAKALPVICETRLDVLDVLIEELLR